MAMEPVGQVREPFEYDATSPVAAIRAAASGEINLATMFQPIVSLDDLEVVGYEAFTRWPGAPGVSPEAVFTYAAAAGMTSALDRRCIRAAVNAATAARLPERSLLLINTEPATTGLLLANDRWLTDARDTYRVVFELTERDLLRHPRALLTKVAALRVAGMGIALDDVGGDPNVLAWLEIIDPDVIKLDLSLIQHRPAPEQARMLNSVYAHHEHSGAVIVAEGIETEEHLEQALAVGATLGQGYRFGRPAPGARITVSQRGVALKLPTRVRPTRTEVRSPFDLASRCGANLRVARKPVLAALTRDIEVQAEQATDRPIVLVAVQHTDHLPTALRDRYRRMSSSCALVAVFGREVPTDLGPQVVGAGLAAEDPLVAEWTLVVLGSHTACALLAQELPGESASEEQRRFAFVVTTDRSLVASAAASLLSRLI